jgi:cell division initiation protein
MAISPIDIQQQRFKTRPFGYDKAQVDLFLELLSEELERLCAVNQGLKEELARSRNGLDEMKGREALLKETLLTTQRMVEDLKNNARRESDIILADAQMRAERIVRDAEERRIQLVNDIQQVKRQRISFESSLRSLVESHLRLLDMDLVMVEKQEEPELSYNERFSLGEGTAASVREEPSLQEED